MMVVDEGSIEHHATVWFKCARDCVGRIGWRASVSGGAEPAFGICFDDETAEIWNVFVDLVDLLAPPIADTRIQRIKRVEASHHFGTAQINGQRKLNAPR